MKYHYVIKGHPLQKLNGLRCNIVSGYNNAHVYFHRPIPVILEKEIDKLWGNKSNKAAVNKKYLEINYE